MRNSRVPVCEASRAWQGAGVIDIDATSTARSLLESLHDFCAVRWDPEPSTGETAPLRCCRHLARYLFSVPTKICAGARPSGRFTAAISRTLAFSQRTSGCATRKRRKRRAPSVRAATTLNTHLAGSTFLRLDMPARCRQRPRDLGKSPMPLGRADAVSNEREGRGNARGEWIFRMAQCIPAMGAAEGALYRSPTWLRIV